MAAKNTVADKADVAELVQFTKEQLLSSDRYGNQRDLVDALLNENETYTVETVDKKIEEYMKGKVK